MIARPSPKIRRAGDERGAVLIFAALGLVIAILAAALAIDVGSVIWRKRDLQVVADLAAADTAQALGATTSPLTQAMANQLAMESATRNNFTFTSPNSLVVALGTFDAALDPAFVVTAPALADAVRVTASRQVPYNFVPGNNTVTVDAIASFGGEPTAAFSIGSKLASLDARSSNVLGPMLSSLFGVNPALTANAVTTRGWRRARSASTTWLPSWASPRSTSSWPATPPSPSSPTPQLRSSTGTGPPTPT